jgi:hypothetical protein
MLNFYIDVISAKMEAGGWPGQLTKDSVECILASLLYCSSLRLSSIFEFLKAASSGPAIICAALSNINSISDQKLQSLTSQQQQNVDQITYNIHNLFWEKECDELLGFLLKYLLRVFSHWQPVISHHIILWLETTLRSTNLSSELLDELRYLCKVIEKSSFSDSQLLSVVKGALAQGECINPYCECF